MTEVSIIRNFAPPKFRKICPTRPEGAEALSPGQRPGLLRMIAYRPVRAKALKLQAIYKAFALTGRLVDCQYTQGVALGWELLPFTFALPFGQRFSIPLRAGDRWFRACCLYELRASFRTELLAKLE